MLNIPIDIKSLIVGIILTTPFYFIMGAVHSSDHLLQYKINTFVEIDNLEGWVNNEIKNGWEPLGGVSISYVKYSNNQWGFQHSQAMVKK